MKNPNRIDPTLDAIREAWKRTPDQRLGQLIVNLARTAPRAVDTFAIEDDQLVERSRQWPCEIIPAKPRPTPTPTDGRPMFPEYVRQCLQRDREIAQVTGVCRLWKRIVWWFRLL